MRQCRSRDRKPEHYNNVGSPSLQILVSISFQRKQSFASSPHFGRTLQREVLPARSQLLPEALHTLTLAMHTLHRYGVHL